jgi:hypothetical protein
LEAILPPELNITTAIVTARISGSITIRVLTTDSENTDSDSDKQ